MNSIANGSVSIQTSSESVPSTPSWFGEVVLMAAYLHGKLTEGWTKFALKGGNLH